MKKLYLALATMALAATLATGCGSKTGNTQADSRTETDSQSNKAGKKGSEINFDDYVTYSDGRENSGKTDSAMAYMDLEKYLRDYGATEIQYLGNDKRSIMYGVKFKNGTVLGMRFRLHTAYDVNCSDCDLVDFVITACKPNHVFRSYSEIDYADSLKAEGVAHWSRLFYIDKLAPEEEDNSDEPSRFYRICVSKPNNCRSFYPIESVSTDMNFWIPTYFDYVFKGAVVPYLDLKKAPLDKDAFNSPDFSVYRRFFK